MIYARSLLLISLCSVYPSLSFSDEKQSDIADQTAVAVTIYNQNLALIKDQRHVSLDQGLNQLAFRGVSAQIRSETALLRSLDVNTQLHVLEQNFDYDVLTPNKLLEKNIGKPIRFSSINPVTGDTLIQPAIVLSTQNGITVKIGNTIVTNPQGSYLFDSVPDNLRDKPTLVSHVTSSSNRSQTVELAYLTGGLSWKADYVAELSQDDSQLDLTGWVTINNQSGTDYNQAKLQLVAGNVNQVQPQRISKRALPMLEMQMADSSSVTEESLFEYHLYSIERPTDIANNQVKQVSLLSANSVPVKKSFVLQGNGFYYGSRYNQVDQKQNIGVFVELTNSDTAHLGIPLPKGVLRVYKNDSTGHAQFIGENTLDHTPKNDVVRIKLGDAFDVTAVRSQTDFKKVKYFSPHTAAYESSYEITLTNAKSEPVTVTVQEPISGDWQIEHETVTHQKINASTAQWQVTIPAESSKILGYTAVVRY